MAIFHEHMTQRVPTDPHWTVNCTAYCAAMLINDSVLGGLLGVTGRAVRAASNERNPDPGSPGLNIVQVQYVARNTFKVPLDDNSGQNWDQLQATAQSGHRVLLQLDYKTMGAYRAQAGGDFGHAVVVVNFTHNGTRVNASDPLAVKMRSYPAEVIHEAARVFARDTGLNTGLRWCNTRAVPRYVK